MGPLTLFLHSQLLEGSVGPFLSKIAEKEPALTPAEIHRLADNLVSEWDRDPELRARSLALIGKTSKDHLSTRDLEMMVRILHATHSKNAEVEYHGKTFPGYNKPISSDKKDKKMMVLAKKGDQVKLVHFGQKGYQHNYSPEAKQNYLTRSAGIRNKSGELTKDDPFSPNYWARKVLWPKGKTGEGSNGPVKTEVRVGSEKKANLVDLLEKRAESFQGPVNEQRSTEDLKDELARVRRQLTSRHSLSEGLAPWQYGLMTAAPAAGLMHYLTKGNRGATVVAAGLGGAAGFGAGKYGLERRETAITRLLSERRAEKSAAAVHGPLSSSHSQQDLRDELAAIKRRLSGANNLSDGLSPRQAAIGSRVAISAVAGAVGGARGPATGHLIGTSASPLLAQAVREGLQERKLEVEKQLAQHVAQDKTASMGLLATLVARKENEEWAAVAKLADDSPLHHVAELGGLGVLAAPYAADLLKHRPGLIGGAAKAYDAALGHSAPKPIQHKMELAGLGTLAAPSAYSLGKWGVNKAKGRKGAK